MDDIWQKKLDGNLDQRKERTVLCRGAQLSIQMQKYKAIHVEKQQIISSALVIQDTLYCLDIKSKM